MVLICIVLIQYHLQIGSQLGEARLSPFSKNCKKTTCKEPLLLVLNHNLVHSIALLN